MDKNKRNNIMTERYAARNEYWNNIGIVEKDVHAPVINNEFGGLPSWPDLRSAYKVVRTENTLIISTDGLSDDFEDGENENGLGLELYAETNDKEIYKMPMSGLGKMWLFELIFQAALNALDNGAYCEALEKFKVLSTEFYDVNIGNGYLSHSGSVGALMGIPRGKGQDHIDFGGKKILMTSVTLLRPSELAAVARSGRGTREEVTQKLIEMGLNNIIDIGRKDIKI